MEFLLASNLIPKHKMLVGHLKSPNTGEAHLHSNTFVHSQKNSLNV